MATEFYRELQRLSSLLVSVPTGYNRIRRFYSGLNNSIKSRLIELNFNIENKIYEELINSAD